MEPDDLTLINRSKDGDERAFQALVVRYQRRAYLAAYGIVRDHDKAMDVAQDAFIKVHKYIGKFKVNSSFYTWLYRITVNLAIDRLRAKNRESRSVEFNDQVLQRAPTEAGVLGTRLGADPHRNVLRKELSRKIHEALAQIPARQRQILLLREIDGLEYDDISRILNIPKGTVMSRLYHARCKLQSILTGYLQEDNSELLSVEQDG